MEDTADEDEELRRQRVKRARRARFDQPRVRVAVLEPPGHPRPWRAARRVRELLARNARTGAFVVAEATGEAVRSGALAGHDVLLCPGGSVFAQQADLGREGMEAVARWVHGGGGGYVGVCAGALLAGQSGFDGAVEGTGILGATTEWTGWDPKEGKWTATVSLTATGIDVLGSSKRSGCGGKHSRHEPAGARSVAASVSLVLTGGSWHSPTATRNTTLGVDIAPFEPLCVLQRVQKTDGSTLPPAAWGDAAPAVAGSFGRGRVAVFGPHPEAERSDAEAHRWLSEAVYWASGKGVGATDVPE